MVLVVQVFQCSRWFVLILQHGSSAFTLSVSITDVNTESASPHPAVALLLQNMGSRWSSLIWDVVVETWTVYDFMFWMVSAQQWSENPCDDQFPESTWKVRSVWSDVSQSGGGFGGWLSNTEDKSRRTRTDEWVEVLEEPSVSVTVRRPVSVDWAVFVTFSLVWCLHRIHGTFGLNFFQIVYHFLLPEKMKPLLYLFLACNMWTSTLSYNTTILWLVLMIQTSRSLRCLGRAGESSGSTNSHPGVQNKTH